MPTIWVVCGEFGEGAVLVACECNGIQMICVDDGGGGRAAIPLYGRKQCPVRMEDRERGGASFGLVQLGPVYGGGCSTSSEIKSCTNK